jgi:flavin-dependent thymidylate synthase
MGDEIVKWADKAQYEAAPILKEASGIIKPVVKLLWATPDPLGAIAAVCKMYKGEPVYDLAEVTDEERRFYWEDSFKSHLRAPHEFVQFHFFVEAVDRSFTHQAVRQRTATFAQESLRFAVKENLVNETVMPPSVAKDENAQKLWDMTLRSIEEAYTSLVNAGIPAEDARGLLPHAVATRLHWRTNLNDLLSHAGNRLCTQAQFHWRHVMLGVMQSIREYKGVVAGAERSDPLIATQWQFELLGQPHPRTFAPICYHTGKCEFKAIFDRGCTIRDRVDANEDIGRSSEHWGVNYHRKSTGTTIEGIDPAEWLLDPTAAREV